MSKFDGAFYRGFGVGLIEGIDPLAAVFSAFPVILDDVCCCSWGCISEGFANNVCYNIRISVKVISDRFFFSRNIPFYLICVWHFSASLCLDDYVIKIWIDSLCCVQRFPVRAISQTADLDVSMVLWYYFEAILIAAIFDHLYGFLVCLWHLEYS